MSDRVLDARGVPTIVAAVVRRGSQLLLVEQQGPHDPHPSWMLPGGRVEEGESVIDALRREIREETGLELVGRPIVAFVAEIEHRGDLADAAYRAITYACETQGAPAPNDPDGFVRGTAWVDADEALTLLAAVAWYEAEPLRRFLSGVAPPGARYRYRVTGAGRDHEALAKDSSDA